MATANRSPGWSVGRTFLLAVVVGPCLTFGTVEAREPQSSVVTDPAAVGLDAATLSRIPARLQEFVDEQQISGAVALVARRGKIVHLSAVGLADVDAKRPMQTDSIFAIASMTKPITAAALMILVDEGKIHLDDPVAKYVPEFSQTALTAGSPARPIAIRDLLTHTSGLVGDQRNEGTLAETAVKMAKRTLAFEPGDKWQYSPGLTVAGRVIEVASSVGYADFVRTRLFVPLGMIDTTFRPSAEQRPRVASVYQRDAEKNVLTVAKHWVSELSDDRPANPSGGLFSTATDMARFYQMMLNRGELDGQRVLSAASVLEMSRTHTGELKTGFTPGMTFGLGCAVVGEPQGVTKMLSPGTFGHGGLFGTQSWADPRREMIFVLMFQRLGLNNGDASPIREAFQELAVAAVRD